MGHIFISYSHKDRAYVQKLQEALQNEGFKVWMDDSIGYGTRWTNEIQEQLDTCDAFIVVESENSYQSEWVHNELIHAQQKSKPIFPILLNGDNWLPVAATQYVDVTDGSLPKEEFYKLLGSVTSRTKKRKPKIPEPSRADQLFSEATKLNVGGNAGRALQLYRQVKEIDPHYPNIDSAIEELEDEKRKGYVDPTGRVQIERIRRRQQDREYRQSPVGLLIAIIACIGILTVATPIAMNSIWQPTSTSVPVIISPTTPVISPIATITDTPAAVLPSGYLEGVLTDKTGRAIPDIVISINRRNGPQTRTDSQGRFVLENVPLGTQEISVWVPNGKVLTQFVHVEKSTSITLIFDTEATLLGVLSIISPMDGGDLEIREEVDSFDYKKSLYRATIYGRADGLQQIFENGFNIWVLTNSNRNELYWLQRIPALVDSQHGTWRADIVLGTSDSPLVNGERWTIIAVAAEPGTGFDNILNTPNLNLLPPHISSNVVTVEAVIK